jgi:hypothetical protein
LQGRAGWRIPGLTILEDDVHRSKQQQIGQFDVVGQELREERFADAKTLGQRRAAARYFSGGMQQSYGCRTHRPLNVKPALPDLFAGKNSLATVKTVEFQQETGGGTFVE